MSDDARLVDARGLLCPLPVLRAKKALREVAHGARIEVLATDPAAVKDFQALCAETGDVLEDRSEQDGVFRFRIRRA